MLFGLGAEVEFINVIDDFPKIVAARYLVFNFSEDFTDFVFNGIGAGGLLPEGVQIWEELLVDEVAEVVAGHGGVVIEFAVLALGRGPAFPAVGLVEDEGVLLAIERGFVGFVLLESVQVFQEQEPRRLFGVIELGRATGLFPKNVVDF